MLQSWRKRTRALARRYISPLYLLWLFTESWNAVLRHVLCCVRLVGASAVPVGTGETDNSGLGEPGRRTAKGETEAGEITGNTAGRKRQTGEHV